MLINLSNHSVSQWDKVQVDAACKQYGEIVDLPFPQIDPEADEKHIEALCIEYREKIETMLTGTPPGRNAIHIMGEQTFCFFLIQALLHQGYRCIASTTRREVTQDEHQKKTSQFRFVRFRDYKLYNSKN